MLLVVIREFIAICGYLEKTGKKAKGYLVISRDELESLLNKNRYLTALEKLKIWKSMNWIDADENQTTKKVCLDGVRRRCVKLDVTVYQTMKELLARGQSPDKTSEIRQGSQRK